VRRTILRHGLDRIQWLGSGASVAASQDHRQCPKDAEPVCDRRRQTGCSAACAGQRTWSSKRVD
jgi:hypothetical protein